MKTFMTLSYLHLWLGNLHPDTGASHGIHYFKKLKGFSLSSLGISSPKDVWLLRKQKIVERKRKQKILCISLSVKFTKVGLLEKVPRQTKKMKITKQYITGCLPLYSCLTTKESSNWWITRRELGFRQQISEAKYQKMLVANIWKHSGEFRRRTKWLRNFADVQDGCEIISQPCEIGLQLGVICFHWL